MLFLCYRHTSSQVWTSHSISENAKTLKYDLSCLNQCGLPQAFELPRSVGSLINLKPWVLFPRVMDRRSRFEIWVLINPNGSAYAGKVGMNLNEALSTIFRRVGSTPIVTFWIGILASKQCFKHLDAMAENHGHQPPHCLYKNRS